MGSRLLRLFITVLLCLLVQTSISGLLLNGSAPHVCLIYAPQDQPELVVLSSWPWAASALGLYTCSALMSHAISAGRQATSALARSYRCAASSPCIAASEQAAARRNCLRRLLVSAARRT